jgi:prolyl 4-hydroxylase
VHVKAYKNGKQADTPITFSVPTEGLTTDVLRKAVKKAVGWKKKSNAWSHTEQKQPWGAFSTVGLRADTWQDMVAHQEVFMYEGGQFIWPGVREGHVATVNVAGAAQPVELETLSLSPLVFSVKNFLEAEECDHIIKQAAPSMHDSGVSHMDKDKGRPSTDWRTSTQTWLSSRQDDVVKKIDYRVANLTAVPLAHQEQVQVLRYKLNQHYHAHHDCFDPSMYASGAGDYHWGHKNRLATVFWYMRSTPPPRRRRFTLLSHSPPPPNRSHPCPHTGRRMPSPSRTGT